MLQLQMLLGVWEAALHDPSCCVSSHGSHGSYQYRMGSVTPHCELTKPLRCLGSWRFLRALLLTAMADWACYFGWGELSGEALIGEAWIKWFCGKPGMIWRT